MNVGEEYIHYEGYERVVKYRTQEEVDEYNRQAIEQEKQTITNRLAELDTQISRVEEDIIASIKLPLHASKQAILDEKNELRARLKSL